MVCPAGQIATTVTGGAVDKTDGCTLVVAGTFSEGGNLTGSLSSNCPQGQIATKIGAINNLDGCEICPTGF